METKIGDTEEAIVAAGNNGRIARSGLGISWRFGGI